MMAEPWIIFALPVLLTPGPVVSYSFLLLRSIPANPLPDY